MLRITSNNNATESQNQVDVTKGKPYGELIVNKKVPETFSSTMNLKSAVDVK